MKTYEKAIECDGSVINIWFLAMKNLEMLGIQNWFVLYISFHRARIMDNSVSFQMRYFSFSYLLLKNCLVVFTPTYFDDIEFESLPRDGSHIRVLVVFLSSYTKQLGW